MATNKRDTGDPRDEEGPRSFTRLIHDLGEGDVQQDLSDDLHELVSAIHAQACQMTGSTKVKGKMVITIDVAENGAGEVDLDVNSKITKPKRRRPTRRAWTTAGGNLTVEHPRQQKLPLQEVTRRGVATEIQEPERNVREV